jgi:hypothetical protein
MYAKWWSILEVAANLDDAKSGARWVLQNMGK